MASTFVFRTPQSKMLASLSEDAAAPIHVPVCTSLLQMEQNSSEHFSYHMPEYGTHFLTKNGVYLSANSYIPHSHPISKTLENHFLIKEVSYVLRDSKFLVISLKKEKLRFLRVAYKDEITLYNRIIEDKDVIRYGEAVQSGNSLLNVRASLGGMNTVFIHDEVHHWPDHELIEFLSIEPLKRLVCTMVYPMEHFLGYRHSLNPSIYLFKEVGDLIQHAPDGNWSESYSQRSKPRVLISKQITDNLGRVWTVCVQRSIADHHLLVIERADLKTRGRLFLNPPELVPPDWIGLKKKSNVAVRMEVLQKTVIYLMSLKKPDKESAIAKVRQLSDDNLCFDEVTLVGEIACHLQKYKWESSLTAFTNGEIFRKAVKDAFPECLVKMFDSDYVFSKVWISFILNLRKEPIEIARGHLSLSGFVLEDESLSEKALNFASKLRPKGFLDPYNLPKEFVKIKYANHRYPSDIFQCWYSSAPTKEEYDQLYFRKDYVVLVDAWIPFHEIKKMYIFKFLNGWSVPCIFFEQMRGCLRRRYQIEFKEDPDLIEVERGHFEKFPHLLSRLEVIFLSERLKSPDLSTDERKGITEAINRSGFVDYVPRSRLLLLDSINTEVEFNLAIENEVECDEIVEVCDVDPIGAEVSLSSPNGLVGNAEFEKLGEPVSIEGDKDAPSLKDVTKSPGREVNFGAFSVQIPADDCVVASSSGQRNWGDISDDSSCSGSYESDIGEDQPTSSGFDFDISDVKSKLESGSVKGACLLTAVGFHLKMDIPIILSVVLAADPFWGKWFLSDQGATLSDVQKIMADLGLSGRIFTEDAEVNVKFGDSFKSVEFYLLDNHVYPTMPEDFKQKSVRISNRVMSLSERFRKNMLALPLVSEINIDIERSRADKLRQSFSAGFTGVALNKFKVGNIPGHNCIKMRNVLTVMGFAGSGKSSGVINLLRSTANSNRVLVISPRTFLANDWIKSLENTLSRKNQVVVRTFESALKQEISKFEVIILDEFGLYPPGYTDLISELASEECCLTLIGDPLQAKYFSKEDIYTVDHDHDFTKLNEKSYKYALYSHRLSKDAKFFDINCDGSETMHPKHFFEYKEPAAMFRDLEKDDFAILSASFEQKKFYSDFGKSFTFGESQGMTFNFCVIVISIESVNCDAGHWMSALTRSRRGTAFLFDGTIGKKEFMTKKAGSIICKYMQSIPVSKEHLIKSAGLKLSKAIIVEKEDRFLKNLDDMEEKLEGDPWLKGMLNLIEINELPEEDIQEVVRHESPPKTHLPLQVENSTMLILSDFNVARENREFKLNGSWSSQFDDLDLKRARQKVNNWAERVESIYPRHQASDSVTFFAAVKKRLRFSDPKRNIAALDRAMGTGKTMLDSLLKWINFRADVQVDMDKIESQYLEKRINKSKALIANHSERSDPDWPIDHFFLFMKSQLCTKFEKRLTGAKAGQTLACFAHRVLVRFSLATRVLEEKIRLQLPSNVYIHTMKNFDQLNDWVVNNVTDKMGTDSDYEAFDRSQDHYVLAFELHFLRHMGWSNDLIEDYKWIKIFLGCRLGHMAIMRFTGEFCTFLFNTLANMAFSTMRYRLSPLTKICFAGDDMYAEGRLDLRHDYDYILKKLTLKAKVNYSEQPMFCGWYMTPYGIVKEPRLILERWLIAEEKGNIGECFINYAIETSYAYRLGERLHELIKNPEDLQEIVRKIVLVKDRLPRSVRDKFTSTGDGFGESQRIPGDDGQDREHHKSCGLLCNLH